jgi:hypothetical protein
MTRQALSSLTEMPATSCNYIYLKKQGYEWWRMARQAVSVQPYQRRNLVPPRASPEVTGEEIQRPADNPRRALPADVEGETQWEHHGVQEQRDHRDG